MTWVGNVAWTRNRYTEIWCVSLKERDYLEATVIGGKIILKWILTIHDWR